MSWLKNKIKQWLLKDEIESMHRAKIHYDRAYALCEKSLYNNEEMKKMYNKITDVAVDVNIDKEKHSWAVVCIAGRPEYIRFVPLSINNTKYVVDFLRQFQHSKYIVDSPIEFRDMLDDYFLR